MMAVLSAVGNVKDSVRKLYFRFKYIDAQIECVFCQAWPFDVKITKITMFHKKNLTYRGCQPVW